MAKRSIDNYSLRPAVWADSAFVYQVKKAALGRYVQQTWGWDEAQQQAFHANEYDPGVMQIVQVDGQDAGTLQVSRSDKAVVLDAIYLLPEFQRKGIGTAVIRDLLAEAEASGLPVRLHVLRVNPAKELYERLGFRTTGETEHYYLMEWAWNRSGVCP